MEEGGEIGRLRRGELQTRMEMGVRTEERQGGEERKGGRRRGRKMHGI